MAEQPFLRLARRGRGAKETSHRVISGPFLSVFQQSERRAPRVRAKPAQKLARRVGVRSGAQALDGISGVLRLGASDIRGARQGSRRPVARLPGALDAFGRGRYRARLEAGGALVAYAGQARHRAAVSWRAARFGTLAPGDSRGSIPAAVCLGSA